MSKQYDTKKSPNFIENPEELAKELFGYDDETLLRELKEAELELEQMKAENPELEAQIAAETKAGYQALMQRIHEENLKPVTEREYEERRREEERKVVRLRPLLKVMFVAAAIMVVLSGMGVVVSARKGFEYQESSTGVVKNKTVWQNDKYKRDTTGLEEAYEEIRDALGINVLTLGYKPAEMEFQEVFINKDKGHAKLIFGYEDKIIYLKEIKHPVDKVSDQIVSDRKKIETVYNPSIGEDFVIEENIIEDSLIEYSAKLEVDGAYYYLSGAMDKAEFYKIVYSLKYHHE